MEFNSVGVLITSIISSMFSGLIAYLPQFFAGLIILLVGLITASLLKHAVLVFFRLLRVERWLEEAKVAKEKDVKVWPGIFAELVRWSVVILFLVPAAETWGISQIASVLNQLLVFLPNVFVAVIVSLVGVVVANITHDVVKHGSKGLGSSSANVLANFARYALLFFTGLIVLNQLGVASDLVRILFTGIVAMVAIAGGLAFGLGGQELAKEILREIQRRLS